MQPFARTLSYGQTFLTDVSRIVPALLLSLVTILGMTSACAGQEQAPPRQKKPKHDFRAVEREYQTVKRGRWVIEVEKQLIEEAPDVATAAVRRLELNLNKVFTLIPKPTHGNLRELKYFVLYGSKSRGGGYDDGLQYCAKNAPIEHPNLDEPWERCILVHSAYNYSKISDLWALKALIHEIGHAQHLENWPSNQAEIKAAWQNAVDTGLYVNVKDDKGQVIADAYARANHLEYFAELTAMYFARCNYTPFNRTELKKYDPTGYAMIQKMWGLSKDDPAPPATKRTESEKKTSNRERWDASSEFSIVTARKPSQVRTPFVLIPETRF